MSVKVELTDGTKIEWADYTFNPWWGCVRVSPACNHCYAEAWAKRTGNDVWGKNADRRFFGDKHWQQPVKWNAKAEKDGVRRRVFCASMADVFEDYPGDLTDPESVAFRMCAAREALWDLIDQTPNLDWLLLTKRPENVMEMVPESWLDQYTDHVAWPENAWVGTTVEDQTRAVDRLYRLVEIPAPVRFVSCEPLLERLNLTPWAHRIDWVIGGGESGGGARPMNPDDIRSLRDQCQRSGMAFLFKQWGDYDETGKRVGKKNAGRLLDGRTWDEFPATTGGDSHS